VSTGNGQVLAVASAAPVIADLHEHFFNDRLWPDFSAIPTAGDPVVRFQTLESGVAQRIGDTLTAIPVPVHHTVPTVGYVVHDETGALVFSGDTGPTEQIWDVARDLGNVRAIIVETSYPDRLGALAEVSGHLTPSQLARELDKMPPCDVFVYHIKPVFHDETVGDLAKLGGRVRVLRDGDVHAV
jgi:cAMP phosphodiesterase